MSFLSNLFGGANQASQEQTMAMLAGLQASGQNATTANTDLTKAAASATAPEHLNCCASALAAGPVALFTKTERSPGIWACALTPKSTEAAETSRNRRIFFIA